MKRGLKKNQVMIAALAVMIAAAGYLNYTGRLFGTEKDDTTQTSADLTNQELLDISEEDTATGSEDILSNDSETEGTPGEAVLTNTTAETTVAQAKAVDQMVALTKRAELEADIESLMAAKGFSEAVVSIGDDSVDVVVKAEELTDANRAKIEEILTRKTEVSPEGIVITPIHE